MNKKIFAGGVIVLFLGLACAPSINANISKESELVEITTEICGMGGGKHTVQLTKEEAEGVDRLFENIRQQLNESNSREEAKKIFNEAIVELDRYGLLGGLSVKQAQRLVTGGLLNKVNKRFVDRIYNKNLQKLDENENVFCLIAGISAYTTIENFRLRFWTNLLTYILEKEYYDIVGFFRFLLTIHILFLQAFPLTLGGIIGFGMHRHIPYNTYYHIPAEGWIQTIGLNGIKRWNGSFWGALAIKSIYDHNCQRWYPGVLYFNGINVIVPKYSLHLLLGSAFWVKIENDN
jgi:hypothetical protein